MLKRFSDEHLHSFRDLSRDRNPLHSDANYARTTQFGRPVVYGMASVVLILGEWAKGRPFTLRTIRGEFRKPLFQDEEYNLEISENGSAVRARYFKERVIQAEIHFEWAQANVTTWPMEAANPIDGTMANNEAEFTLADIHYAPEISCWDRFSRAFSIEREQLSWHQLSAILWSSYFVGMQYPGGQALYSGFEFVFDQSAADPMLRLHIVNCKFDKRFGLALVTARGDGISKFSIRAFRRPDPVCYRLENLPPNFPKLEALKGKTVFISGSSRGFGSVLALGFAYSGAKVLLNYRAGHSEAEKIASSLKEIGQEAFLMPGDLASDSECERMLKQIRSDHGGLDILVNNAFAPIRPTMLEGQASAEIQDFVKQSLAMTATPTLKFLPLMNQHGLIIQISSIFFKKPFPGFLHYIAAKGAIEGFIRGLSSEVRNQIVIVVRPPRMLTDQTNLVGMLEIPRSAVDVASHFFDSLGQLPQNQRFHEIDL